MSVDSNKTTMQRIYDVINTGDLALANEVIAVDVIEHVPGSASGLEGFKQSIAILRTGFPDLRFTIEDMIAEGDLLAARFTMRGTHTGEFLGMAPTNKQVTMTGIDIVRFRDGKAVEHWANGDDLGMLQQLGVIPELAHANG